MDGVPIAIAVNHDGDDLITTAVDAGEGFLPLLCFTTATAVSEGKAFQIA
jgi:hypothetical protein